MVIDSNDSIKSITLWNYNQNVQIWVKIKKKTGKDISNMFYK